MTATDTNGSGKAVRTFPTGFVWAPPRPHTRSKEPRRPMDADRPFGTRSAHTRQDPGGDTGDIACDFYNRSEGDLKH